MGRFNSSENALQSQYNMAVAQIRALQEQLETKERQYRIYEQQVDVVDGHMRKLCEMILAKDKSQMTLGTAKSWHGYSTDELITMARKVFIQYNQDRTKLLQEVMAVAEARGQELESLKDQIGQMLTSGNVAGTTYEEVVQQAEKRRQEQAALDSTDNKTRKAVQEGRVALVVEEDGDFDEQEMGAISAMINTAEAAKLTPSSKPVSRAQAKQDRIKQERKAAAEAHVVDLNKYMEKCGENEWKVMEIIGTMGLARGVEIEKEFSKFNSNSGAFRRAHLALTNAGALDKDVVALPLSKNALFLWLTDIGIRMFKAHFEKDPVPSEIVEVRKEHDNIQHGYGIRDLERLLVESKRYKSVCSSNRKNPIDVEWGGQKLQYIPDILCKADRWTDYYEYELGTHTDFDFGMKLNKMSRVTKYLNIVCPNREVLRVVKKKVDKWIQGRGSASLKNTTVRIGTVVSIQNDSDWIVVYELAKGPTPVKDLS